MDEINERERDEFDKRIDHMYDRLDKRVKAGMAYISLDSDEMDDLRDFIAGVRLGDEA